MVCSTTHHLSRCAEESAHTDTWYSTGETGKALGDKWKAMSADEKKPYEDKSAALKVAYEKAKAQYEAKGR